MGIIIDAKKGRAHLFTKNTSYVIETFEGELIHAYWGKRLVLPNTTPLVPIEPFSSFYPNPNPDNKTYSLDTIPREFPDFGRSDYRNPAVRFRLIDGTRITKFQVVSFEKQEGKPKIPGLPATYVEAADQTETLVITLLDEKSGVKAMLYYSVFKGFDVITRHVHYVNQGRVSVKLENAMSASVDFYNDNNFDMIHFNGSWARERDLSRVPVGNGTHIIESKRGASSHMQNPLVLLARKNTDERSGEVYGMNFVYSGSFKALVEVNSYKTTRFQMGLNDFDFDWHLEPGDTFDTPEVVMTYSDEGFNGLSHHYHSLYRERLCRGKYRDTVRPILINNWEATYFNFTQEKLESIIDAAGNLGVELFVLDDGWFGKRDSDESGLGDWSINFEKLPKGIKGVADYAIERQVSFGLWFEPEMVSPDSDLYRAHPNWCLHVERHTRSQGRNQLVLDLSRKDVQDYLIETIGGILRSNPIGYVKWDMNRHMTEVGSMILDSALQKEVSHRYMLGLYRVLETLVNEFEEILFESCSGGGGRFDPGMLYYMPQTWTSDNTDAHERISIQYGTSFAYPPITMGAHVSVSPNHQVGRITELERRGLTSMMANLGYELDLSALTEADFSQVKRQIDYYKTIRGDIQFGRFYRLQYDDQTAAFLIESKDQRRYYLFYYRGLNRANQAKETLPLVYLSEGEYRATPIGFKENQYETLDSSETKVGEDRTPLQQVNYPSSFLNGFGYTLPTQNHDFDGHLIVFTKTESEQGQIALAL